MDDPEGGGTLSGASMEVGAASLDIPGQQHIPSISRPSNSDHGRSVKTKTKPTASASQLEAYHQMFSSDNRTYDKFFIITSTDSNKTLSMINTVKANKELEQFIGGTPLDVRELRSGSILVEVATFNQSDKIQKLKALDGCRVDVRSNDRLNQCKGTIYYLNDPKFTDQEIADAIN